MVLSNVIISAVIRELESKGYEMERDNDYYILTSEKGIVDITKDENTISITFLEL